MRDRRVRLGFVALILSFPLLIQALGDRGPGRVARSPRPIVRAALGPQLPPAIWAAEGALGAGLVIAGLARDRLRPPTGSNRPGRPRA